MKILWFTWKDMSHPWAGGAELVNERLAERLVHEGHEVIFIVGGYKDCEPTEIINGYTVIRVGGFYSVFWQAYRYYKKHLQDWPDVVIEEINTLPFFSRFYIRQPSILFIHQLCRQIWFYQMKWPLSLIGFLVEPLYLQLLRGKQIITISESTKQDLARFGFKEKNITVISQGMDLPPIDVLQLQKKYKVPTLLSLGAMRPMKRTLDQVKAFEFAKQQLPALRLKLAGDASGEYGQAVLEYIAGSPYVADIEYLGHVTAAKRLELMQRSQLIMSTSVKEGWGLTVTEAASQGTPAVVYDIDGVRDSTHLGQTGVIASQNSPKALAEAIVATLQNRHSYSELCARALEASRQYTFERSYTDFRYALLIQTMSKTFDEKPSLENEAANKEPQRIIV